MNRNDISVRHTNGMGHSLSHWVFCLFHNLLIKETNTIKSAFSTRIASRIYTHPSTHPSTHKNETNQNNDWNSTAVLKYLHNRQWHKGVHVLYFPQLTCILFITERSQTDTLYGLHQTLANKKIRRNLNVYKVCCCKMSTVIFSVRDSSPQSSFYVAVHHNRCWWDEMSTKGKESYFRPKIR